MSSPLSPGTKLGRYEIRSQLGVGGMGEVYLAWDSRLGRTVALKLLLAETVADDNRMRRFTQEARAASSLSHPNIAYIYELEEIEGLQVITMEFVEGPSLRNVMSTGRLDLNQALDIATQMSAALAAAHTAGVIHRDIKPENAILRSDGYVKILDFGLAKLLETSLKAKSGGVAQTVIYTDPGILMGTVSYMSPEQARGLELDGRTDIFSLGVVLYEMLTGTRPFDGVTLSDTIVRIANQEQMPLTHFLPQVPAELERALRKALAKDREERYQTAKDLAIDLRRLRQRLEFEAEMERSVAPDRNTGAIALSTGPTAAATVVDTAEGVRGAPRRRLSKTIDSLAILPLVNACADASTEYLSDGITEGLINNLSQLPKLRVVPRSTVFRYKGREDDPQVVGRELNVRAVLIGKVCQVGDSLVVQADLIDVEKEAQLWGEQYNRKMSGIFEIQEEITREIANKLRPKLSSDQKRRLARRQTGNHEAYEAYLKGRYSWNKRTEEGLLKSREYFQHAIDIDPSYALAYAGLADSYALPGIAEYGFLPPHEAMPRAKAAAMRALDIDNRLTEAQTTLAHVRAFYDWEWSAAEKEFKRAIELGPGYPFAYHWYALYLAAMGRHEEAIAAERKAQELDPLSQIINKNVGTILYFAGRYDQAIDQYRVALELDRNFPRTHMYLGMSYVQKGLYDEGMSEYQKAFDNSGGSLVLRALTGHALALSGNPSEALKIIDELQKHRAQKYVPAFNTALIYLGLAEVDQAFDWLTRACDERSSWLASLKVDPLFANIRGDTRFTSLVRRVGLV